MYYSRIFLNYSCVITFNSCIIKPNIKITFIKGRNIIHQFSSCRYFFSIFLRTTCLINILTALFFTSPSCFSDLLLLDLLFFSILTIEDFDLALDVPDCFSFLWQPAMLRHLHLLKQQSHTYKTYFSLYFLLHSSY